MSWYYLLGLSSGYMSDSLEELYMSKDVQPFSSSFFSASYPHPLQALQFNPS